MITILGPNGIKATVLAYSITKWGQKLITWEIEYPRLILAELNTHRELSRNSFSSRAVPFLKMLEQLQGEPVRFGANQAGMQDKGEDFNAPVKLDDGVVMMTPRGAWSYAKKLMIGIAQGFSDAGYHKQVYNRLLEPWQMQKTIVSATQVDNFFWLRDHEAADPTLHALARVMREAMEVSTPDVLVAGQWHLPYIVIVRDHDDGKDDRHYMNEDDVATANELTLEQAIKVSCARCAAVSYRNEGYGLEKSIEVFDRLVGGDRKHASAFEHCATPMQEPHFLNGVNVPTVILTWEAGITHMDRQANLWSGNFKGWIQYRKLIPGECYEAV